MTIVYTATRRQPATGSGQWSRDWQSSRGRCCRLPPWRKPFVSGWMVRLVEWGLLELLRVSQAWRRSVRHDEEWAGHANWAAHLLDCKDSFFLLLLKLSFLQWRRFWLFWLGLQADLSFSKLTTSNPHYFIKANISDKNYFSSIILPILKRIGSLIIITRWYIGLPILCTRDIKVLPAPVLLEPYLTTSDKLVQWFTQAPSPGAASHICSLNFREQTLYYHSWAATSLILFHSPRLAL